MKTLSLANTSMTAEERVRLVRLLRDALSDYLAYLEDVNEAQWTWKKAPELWSVGETAEHILLSEIALFGGVQRAIQNPADPDWENKTAGKTELLERVMPHANTKTIAPERVRPLGLFKAEVIRRFQELRGNTIRFAEETEIPLKEHTADHPFPVFNTLSAYQWLLYIPLHNLRHNQQIAEIKAAPGYPK